MAEAAITLAVGLVLGGVFAVADRAVTAGSEAVATPLRQPLRLVLQQRRTTPRPDMLLWRVACVAVPLLAFGSLAVVPVAGWTLLSTTADLVWFNTMEVLLWAAVWLAGWGPNAVFSLVGGYRFLAQGLAYELPLMFAIITAGLAAGSLRVTDVVAAQAELWFIVTMPVAFVLFLTGAAAFAFWGPFAAPSGSDIAGGVTSELSGVERLLVDGGRAVFLGAASAMAVALFLGGGEGPWLPDPAWFALKTLLVIGGLVVVGRSVPVIRPDRLVELSWVVLVPASLLQTLFVAVLVLAGVYD